MLPHPRVPHCRRRPGLRRCSRSPCCAPRGRRTPTPLRTRTPTAARLLHTDAARAKHLLLLGNTDGLAGAAGGLGVLAAHTDAPVVAQTAMVADLLQALQVVTQGGVDLLGDELRSGKGRRGGLEAAGTTCRMSMVIKE